LRAKARRKGSRFIRSRVRSLVTKVNPLYYNDTSYCRPRPHPRPRPPRSSMQRRKAVGKSDETQRGLDPDRLNNLLSAFTVLRDDARSLIDRIRGSLEEMRELRRELHEQRGKVGGPKSRFPVNRATHLERQYKLTAREVEVALLLAQGRSNEAIAKALRISAHTARHHTQRILLKLRVHSRAEAGAKIRG
jgi:DNA-binding CsgD family transcriptional regulator